MKTIPFDRVELRHEPLSCEVDDWKNVRRKSRGWIPARIPLSVHQTLLNAGEIDEPLEGLNFQSQTWIESRSWWVRIRFDCPDSFAQAEGVELDLQGLDFAGGLVLNGTILGDHVNAFRPFRREVGSLLLPGKENELLIRLTTGLERVDPARVDELNAAVGTEEARGFPERGEARRVFLRKPQYGWGWDWGPRLPPVGVQGPCLLRELQPAVIRSVGFETLDLSASDVPVEVRVELEAFSTWASGDVQVCLELSDEQGRLVCVEEQVLHVLPGRHPYALRMTVPDARRWWPRTEGEQPLYDLEVRISRDGKEWCRETRRVGIRTVELDAREGRFAFVVNGRRIFAQGANWIPADSDYLRIDDGKVRRLVEEAAASGLNMLRVWGGGFYEQDAFWDACDALGILVWHDFMFACTPYPDFDADFVREVEQEAAFQTGRLAHRASLACWCGNNECQWLLQTFYAHQPLQGADLYNRVLPEAVRRHAPHVPYWPGSPFGGKDNPGSRESGDTHEWFEGFFFPEMTKRNDIRQYDCWKSLFVSEYGYPGPCVPESIAEYLGLRLDEIERSGERWRQHSNTVFPETLNEALLSDYGVDPARLSLKDWCRLGGLRQGRMLEASLDALRAQPQCHGALYWMFNDCWGETGWTTLDAYLRRKPSFAYVRRALAPRRLVIRRNGKRVTVRAVNFSRSAWRGTLRIAFVNRKGETVWEHREKVSLSADQERTLLLDAEVPVSPRQSGGWICRLAGETSAVWCQGAPRQVYADDPGLTLRWKPGTTDGTWTWTVNTRRPAHGVHLEGVGDLGDVMPGFPVKGEVQNAGPGSESMSWVDLRNCVKKKAPQSSSAKASGAQASMF